MKKNTITQKRLKEVLDYNSKTGIFVWKISNSNRSPVGSIAGTKTDNGYISISIDGVRFLAHRLSWLYVKGYMPEPNIDHKDRIRNHNWIKNLRQTTQVCNTRNTGNFKHNTSGIKGISLYKRTGKYQAHIKIDRKKVHIGTFGSFDAAVLARYQKEKELDWSGCDSNSPAFLHCRENKLIPWTVKV